MIVKEPELEAQAQLQSVDVVVSRYEWICPGCGHYQTEIEFSEYLQCVECEHVFAANPPEHVYA